MKFACPEIQKGLVWEWLKKVLSSFSDLEEVLSELC